MRLTLSVLTAFAVLLLAAVATADHHEDLPKPKPSQLDALKKLEGEWLQVGEDGKPTDVVAAEYQVTAGGFAVLEVLLPGSEMEMMSMYYMDGDDLTMTHYCMLGNQPMMKATASKGKGEIDFMCAGGSNMKSENDPHMHQATFSWPDDDHFVSTWYFYSDGKEQEKKSFEMVRK